MSDISLEGRDIFIAMHEHKYQYQWCLKRVTQLLGTKSKAYMWMITKNPLLGEVAPVTMIANGRWHRLEYFIKGAENATTR